MRNLTLRGGFLRFLAGFFLFGFLSLLNARFDGFLVSFFLRLLLLCDGSRFSLGFQRDLHLRQGLGSLPLACFDGLCATGNLC